MKFRSILLILFLSACVTGTKISKVDSLNFEQVRSLALSSSTENEVVDVLGQPTGRTDKVGYYTLHYDSSNGLQRLSINFSTESHKLSSALWIPREGEKEYSLTQAKAVFSGASFKEVINSNNNPHSISLDAVSYIDEKTGVTIRYDREQNVVEAIAMFDVNTRLPAGTDTKDKTPFTFGDEPAISK